MYFSTRNGNCRRRDFCSKYALGEGYNESTSLLTSFIKLGFKLKKKKARYTYVHDVDVEFSEITNRLIFEVHKIQYRQFST